MKTLKLISLQKFKNERIECSKILGGLEKFIETGGGTIQGMKYKSDGLHDSDDDGRWGKGETMDFYWDNPDGGTHMG